MQKPQVVAYFLVPADQHAPEAIHPRVVENLSCLYPVEVAQVGCILERNASRHGFQPEDTP